ncbi:hypothetical protein N752_29555 [Desulforamulus aquiferis]|nr:hypothetical protein N752_29555 [Desulforamulus aquiferis]
MVKMAQIENIRKMYFREGLSVREISRRTGHHRDTIAKYLDLDIAQPPKYKLSKDKLHPVLGPFIPIINEILSSDETKPRKQRHTARRIYHRLVDEYDYPGGYSTVTDYLRQVRTKAKEAYLPLQFGLGTHAQVDWGQALFVLNGIETVAHLFLVKLSASGAFYVYAYPFEKQEHSLMVTGERLIFLTVSHKQLPTITWLLQLKKSSLGRTGLNRIILLP